jgi:antitoxin (DNA-binding transcriptional repressor) of toxin-antitoxin stability system
MRKATPIASFKARLSEHLQELAQGPLVVTRHGRPVAIVLSPPSDPEDLDSLLLAYDPGFWEIVRKSEQSRLLSSDEFWRRVEKRYRHSRPRS